MRLKTPKEKRTLIIKTTIRFFLYFLIIFFCFVTMNAGTGIKPILLIPVAICISANTEELRAAFIGTACGFLIDIACGKLYGYNAIILTIVCVAISLLFNKLLKQRFVNILIVTSIASLIQGALDYKFYYEIWGYENVEKIFTDYIIISCMYTILSAIPIYFIIYLINHILMPKHHLSIEEIIKNNSQE